MNNLQRIVSLQILRKNLMADIELERDQELLHGLMKQVDMIDEELEELS